MKKTAFKIKKSVYDFLLFDIPYAPPECGGILGGINEIVMFYVKDLGSASPNSNRYYPDVDKLNSVIAEWTAVGIDFMGIFHTHPSGDEKLSQADYEYIESILENVSEYTDSLYFPLLIPKEKIMCYCAVNIAGEIDVFQVAIDII